MQAGPANPIERTSAPAPVPASVVPGPERTLRLSDREAVTLDQTRLPHARVEIAYRRVSPDLDDHQRGDEENAEPRSDA